MDTKRINLISGPRNISTALMYSFANRPDTTVVDEPMYAYYLKETQIVHPGKDDILEALPQDIEEVKKKHIFQSVDSEIYFIKGMAHHYLDLNLHFIKRLKNVFLIRDPYKIINSFAKVIPNPTMQDIGLKKEYEMYEYLKKNSLKPIVLDSAQILLDPQKVLSQMCESLEIPFTAEMLSWSRGALKEDGVWAKYWYNNVHNSTGFGQVKRKDEELHERLQPLYNKARPYYERLLKNAIAA